MNHPPVPPQPPFARYADLVLRAGVGLRPGQGLLLADPFAHHGVPPEATGIVDLLTGAARRLGARDVTVLWANPALNAGAPSRAFRVHLARSAGAMLAAIGRGDALLFLLDGAGTGSPATPTRAAEVRNLAWEHFGPVSSRLTTWNTNWSVVPLPTAAWAGRLFANAPAGRRPTLLWDLLGAVLRLNDKDPVATWLHRTATLARRCEELNARRPTRLRYRGPGTDLEIGLPEAHVWTTARGLTKRGTTCLGNLPTEEVFTAPHRDRVEGCLRCDRPVVYGGEVIDGIELAFRRGRVVAARAARGGEMLERVLCVDAGARRLGEVALVESGYPEALRRREFLHPVLDENAVHHVALGSAYPFTIRGGAALTDREFRAAGGNLSLVHVDLPLEVEVTMT